MEEDVMSDGRIVYVKDDAQKKEFKKQYPNARAEVIKMEDPKGMEDLLPMVCITKDNKERCESGEKGIALLTEE